jgi:hypothetical protein
METGGYTQADLGRLLGSRQTPPRARTKVSGVKSTAFGGDSVKWRATAMRMGNIASPWRYDPILGRMQKPT